MRTDEPGPAPLLGLVLGCFAFLTSAATLTFFGVAGCQDAGAPAVCSAALDAPGPPLILIVPPIVVLFAALAWGRYVVWITFAAIEAAAVIVAVGVAMSAS